MPEVDLSSLVSTAGTPQQTTLELRKKEFAQALLGSISEQFAARVQQFNNLWIYVWRNPSGLFPRQAIGALGTKAKLVFTLSAMEAQYLNTIKPGVVSAELPEGVTVTFNDDGSLKEFTEAA